jgi:hypothetical protein
MINADFIPLLFEMDTVFRIVPATIFNNFKYFAGNTSILE